jgi:hypothetical protein
VSENPDRLLRPRPIAVACDGAYDAHMNPTLNTNADSSAHTCAHETPATESVDILWTGGWDSTFRVLSLLHSGATVRPHYVLDIERASTEHELAACASIRCHMPREWAARLSASLIIDRRDIRPDPGVSAAFERLRSAHWMGDQYDWLARYCHQHAITIELAIHRDDKARDAIAASVDGDRLGARASADEAMIFGCYHFPVFDLGKVDMLGAARQAGFAHLMNLTWFCHTPLFGQPCGVCNPCAYTIQEGLAHRLPRAARFRYAIRPVAKRVRRLFGV